MQNITTILDKNTSHNNSDTDMTDTDMTDTDMIDIDQKKTNSVEYRYSTMSLKNLNTMFNLAKEENWMPMKDQSVYAKLLSASENFFCIKNSNNNSLITGISNQIYKANNKKSNKLGMLGLFITKKSERGNGYGTKLFKHTLSVTKCPLYVLYSVEKATTFYEKYGFKTLFPIGSYIKKIRCHKNKSIIFDKQVIECKGDRVDWLLNYDRKKLGYDRRPFLQRLLRSSKTLALLYKSHSGDILGYATCTQSDKGDGGMQQLAYCAKVGMMTGSTSQHTFNYNVALTLLSRLCFLLQKKFNRNNPNNGFALFLNIPSPYDHKKQQFIKAQSLKPMDSSMCLMIRNNKDNENDARNLSAVYKGSYGSIVSPEMG